MSRKVESVQDGPLSRRHTRSTRPAPFGSKHRSLLLARPCRPPVDQDRFPALRFSPYGHPTVRKIHAASPRRDRMQSAAGQERLFVLSSYSPREDYLLRTPGDSQATLTKVVLLSFNALTSRMGGRPKNRLYSRLNWLTLS